MTDLIDRQAAIEKYGNWYVEEGTEEGFISDMKHFLEMLPSAEPERKRGVWIIEPISLKCSACCQYSGSNRRTNFCHNCGADMRGEE